MLIFTAQCKALTVDLHLGKPSGSRPWDYMLWIQSLNISFVQSWILPANHAFSSVTEIVSSKLVRSNRFTMF